MNAATLVRETRRRHRITQRSLARRCRTSQTYISRVERGDVSPSVDTLVKLLQAMGERLELRAVPGPFGNQRAAELHTDAAELTPAERIVQAAELSHAATSIAAGPAERT